MRHQLFSRRRVKSSMLYKKKYLTYRKMKKAILAPCGDPDPPRWTQTNSDSRSFAYFNSCRPDVIFPISLPPQQHMFMFFAPDLRKHDSNGDFCFVYKNKWIHQNHCFPNPHNDLHVVLKPTPNNKKRENRYVDSHITVFAFLIVWCRL